MKNFRGCDPELRALQLRRLTTISKAVFTRRKPQSCSTIKILVDILGSRKYFGLLSKVQKRR